MANEEVLGPRKTMFILVIVVGCFAVLWPRILSPLLLGSSREQLKPNQFDREAGCCEVIFESEVAVLELMNEVCSLAVGSSGKLTPYSIAECRKTVNETCGVDIAAFLKKEENVGKTTKTLLDTIKNSNSSCLKEHFGVPVWNIGTHLAQNSWMLVDKLKQERQPIRGMGPHPALRERGRAIPPETPPAPPRPHVTLPPHVRVRSSPLSGYFELDIKPPPIPGMRPPMGAGGGPMPAPKSSVGFVMPVYTICIIVFFVYTLSKILFKRAGASPFEPISPDPHFRRRVFGDESRSSSETKLVVTAISGLVAEVQQQMEAGYTQQRQDVQDNQNRLYTNGTVPNNAHIHIITSEPREQFKENGRGYQYRYEKEKSPDMSSDKIESVQEDSELPFNVETKYPTSELLNGSSLEQDKSSLTPNELSLEKINESIKKLTENNEIISKAEELVLDQLQETFEPMELRNKSREPSVDDKDAVVANNTTELIESNSEMEYSKLEPESIDTTVECDFTSITNDMIKLSEDLKSENDKDSLVDETNDNVSKIATEEVEIPTKERQLVTELLEDALREDNISEDIVDVDSASVKVVGMELTAHSADGGTWPRAEPPPVTPVPPHRVPHEAEDVKSIFLETGIPQQSRVIVTDFEDHSLEQKTPKNTSLVVSGKMTLSLIQDAPRDTPEREPESTADDFTTADAITQPAADENDEEISEEEEEEIEIEEIEEEVEDEEDEEIELVSTPEQKKTE